MNEKKIVGDLLARRPQGCRAHHFWLITTLAAALLLPAATVLAASPPSLTAPFVMGSDSEESSLTGKWYRRIYAEAFRRLGVPLTITVSPTARLSILADEGQVDGQTTRLAIYAEAHPNQRRLKESVHEVRLALFAFQHETRSAYPQRLEDLTTGNWLVEYRRGVAICEKTLKPLLPAERLSDITSAAQGMQKLKAGRTDLYCDFELAVQSELLTPDYRGVNGFRPVMDLGVRLPLYPYVHKSRAELAPRLASVLKKMKTEGLIERYLREVQRELHAVR